MLVADLGHGFKNLWALNLCRRVSPRPSKPVWNWDPVVPGGFSMCLRMTMRTEKNTSDFGAKTRSDPYNAMHFFTLIMQCNRTHMDIEGLPVYKAAK